MSKCHIVNAQKIYKGGKLLIYNENRACAFNFHVKSRRVLLFRSGHIGFCCPEMGNDSNPMLWNPAEKLKTVRKKRCSILCKTNLLGL